MNELTNSLAELAQQINREHEQCRAAFTAGVQHAINAGDLLIQAKALCEHGAWGTWLAENCTVSERTAQAYMRVARNREALEAKTLHVADLSFRDALNLLAEPRQEESEPDELQKAQAWAAEFDAWWKKARVELDTLRARLDQTSAEPSSLTEIISIKNRALDLQNEAAVFHLDAIRGLGRCLNWLELTRDMGDVNTMIGYAELMRDLDTLP